MCAIGIILFRRRAARRSGDNLRAGWLRLGETLLLMGSNDIQTSSVSCKARVLRDGSHLWVAAERLSATDLRLRPGTLSGFILGSRSLDPEPKSNRGNRSTVDNDFGSGDRRGPGRSDEGD